MPKMPASELKAMLAAEYAEALAALTGSSKLSAERADAMDYYLGDMARDMPVPEGRSRAVSTDVADTIEGLMPSLIEIFCGSDLERPGRRRDVNKSDESGSFLRFIGKSPMA